MNVHLYTYSFINKQTHVYISLYIYMLHIIDYISDELAATSSSSLAASFRAFTSCSADPRPEQRKKKRDKQ